jgi:hypothetical protein
MKRAALLLLSVVAAATVGCGRKAVRTEPGRAEVWLMNYLRDQRVGYSVYRVQPLVDGFRFENYIRISLAMAGKAQMVQSRSTVRTDREMALRDFEFSFGSQDRSFSATGRVENGKLVVTQAGGKPRTKPLSGPVFPVSALGRMVIRAKLGKDSLFRVPVFDVSVLDVVAAEVRVWGKERVNVGGTDYDAIRYSVKMAKIETVVWMDGDGMALREESPPAMRSERAAPDAVLAGEKDDAKIDVLRVFSVPADTLIPEPELVRQARVELSGIEPGEYELGAENQRVVSEKPLAIETTAPELPAGPVALPVAGQDELLEPSLSVQSDDPGIRKKAAAEAGRETDAVAVARKLVSFVFTAMEKEATASFPTAKDVLASMKGDCNEHAVLLAALCRAAGIPARVVIGLVYLDGSFYYHAWNELYLGRWVGADATFGEFPASALHVRLGEGELVKQAEILGLVGRLKMRIVGYSS